MARGGPGSQAWHSVQATMLGEVLVFHCLPSGVSSPTQLHSPRCQPLLSMTFPRQRVPVPHMLSTQGTLRLQPRPALPTWEMPKMATCT